ncbi:MAG TPA: class I SAM-dependent methyltransferase [Candidatus Saccharimonadales bacterium]|nr:class I SAM-dependent methyltransferase [Candidatus Saccharimonadales bacterium]
MAAAGVHPGSFRDPAGFIFTHDDGAVYRQINQAGREDFDFFISSGLYDALVREDLIVAHNDAPKNLKLAADAERYKVIAPTRIPFISYPYEWSFLQFKDAALLTLRIQKIALEHGMILKDASAYNVQFVGKKPVFIDTLSFKKYTPGEPWEGYKQFCEHFVAPLALAHYASYDILKLLEANIEGVSLEFAAKLLPKRARFAHGLLSHVYLHAASKKRYENAGSEGKAVPKRQLSKFALDGLMVSLERSIKGLRPPKQQTEWGDYYTFTNYSDKGFKEKQQIVRDLLAQVKPKPQIVWDLGANNGEFSVLAAEMGAYTVAFDIDPVAVGRNYAHADATGVTMLPLVQDCTNPSTANGWMGRERDSLFARGPADVVMALAIIHHLAIGRNLPLPRIAEFLAVTGKRVIVEFVPKGDSKVDILLSSRKDIFPDYDESHFEAAMNKHFKLAKKVPIKDTKRTMYLFETK